VLHAVTQDSPMHGAEPEAMRKQEMELTVTVMGIDGTSSQTVYGSHTYDAADIRFGARFADMLSPKPGGRLELDYSKLHETVPAPL
jgi:inward rectifier potassium channel